MPRVVQTCRPQTFFMKRCGHDPVGLPPHGQVDGLAQEIVSGTAGRRSYTTCQDVAKILIAGCQAGHDLRRSAYLVRFTDHLNASGRLYRDQGSFEPRWIADHDRPAQIK